MADPRDELIAELRRQLAERDVIIAELRAELAALKEAFAKSSRNSSKPPSSDGPGAKTRPKKAPLGGKPGGQPGHKRHERVLVPPEKVHEVVPCIPKQCDECAGLLHGRDPEPHRHQVFELPRVEPVVTEYQQHALGCGRCGHRTRGKLPVGVPTRAFGPTVDAVVAVFMGVYRLTKRQVPELMRDIFSLHISVGACYRPLSKRLLQPLSRTLHDGNSASALRWPSRSVSARALL